MIHWALVRYVVENVGCNGRGLQRFVGRGLKRWHGGLVHGTCEWARVCGGRGLGALSGGCCVGGQRSGLLARKSLYCNTGAVFVIELINVCCRLSVVLNNEFIRGQLDRKCFTQGPLGIRGAKK